MMAIWSAITIFKLVLEIRIPCKFLSQRRAGIVVKDYRKNIVLLIEIRRKIDAQTYVLRLEGPIMIENDLCMATDNDKQRGYHKKEKPVKKAV